MKQKLTVKTNWIILAKRSILDACGTLGNTSHVNEKMKHVYNLSSIAISIYYPFKVTKNILKRGGIHFSNSPADFEKVIFCHTICYILLSQQKHVQSQQGNGYLSEHVKSSRQNLSYFWGGEGALKWEKRLKKSQYFVFRKNFYKYNRRKYVLKTR